MSLCTYLSVPISKRVFCKVLSLFSDKEKRMASASSCLWLLVLVAFSALMVINYQIMNSACARNVSSNSSCNNLQDLKEEQVKEMLEKNANSRGIDSQILKKFRVLLGMRTPKSSQLRNERTVYSPAHAPLAEIAVPDHLPLIKPHANNSKKSLGHWHHMAPVHSLKPKSKNEDKSNQKRLVIIITTSVGIAFVIVSCAILACKRCSRIRRSERLVPLSSRRSKFQLPTSATNKVSFDPVPELFYLNALTLYLESDLSKQTYQNLSSNGSMSYLESDITVKQTSDSKSAFANGSMSDVILSNGELLKYESDIFSSSETEKLTSEDQKSDNESFHSIHSSHSLDQSLSDAPEKNFCQHYEDCSPSSFSYQPVQDKENFSSPYLMSRATCNAESTDQENSKCASNLHSVSTKLPQKEPNISSEKTAMAIPSMCQIMPPGKPLLPPHIPPTKLPMPPTLPSSLPPPPPPIKPPLLRSECNLGKSPPPPPCSPQPDKPIGKDGPPLPKLKPLHWVKVSTTPERSMVWDRIRSSSFEFDERMIESLFGYSQSSARPTEARNKSPSRGKNVMEHKRLQNITILMKALNCSTEQVFQALMQGRGLSIQQLEALVRMAPTKEEEEKFSMYEGDIDNLEPAEKFLEMVLRIPYAFARSELMLYRETFQDEADHLRKSFEMLDEACEELRSSGLFLKLLEAVLKTGNRMNVGTVRGGARAFKLDALLKLADVKGTDGKTTLLHFVVQEMIRTEGVKTIETTKRESEEIKPVSVEQKDDDCQAIGQNLMSRLGNELSNVKKTASIDLDVLVSSVSNLSNGLNQLNHLLEDLSPESGNEEFQKTMGYFVGNAETTIKKLKDKEELVQQHVREITEYYHGDMSREETNPLRIFVIVRDFLAMLDRACKEVRSSKSSLGTFPVVVPFS